MINGLTLPLLIAGLFGYLLGSIPFGLLLTRMAGLGDVRAIGSGNIGATNVLRTGKKGLAAATLILDGLKGTVAVLVAPILARILLVNYAVADPTWPAIVQASALAAGLGAFLGHLFPVWIGFRGGKGVATYIGVLFGLVWPFGLLFCGAWLIIALLSRYSSLSSLSASAITPAALFFTGHRSLTILFGTMTLLLFWKHQENISRLIKGTESRIGEKSTKSTPAPAD
jgi:acyl phosphate:glycerol-3-phosphate acyltransferase